QTRESRGVERYRRNEFGRAWLVPEATDQRRQADGLEMEEQIRLRQGRRRERSSEFAVVRAIHPYRDDRHAEQHPTCRPRHLIPGQPRQEERRSERDTEAGSEGLRAGKEERAPERRTCESDPHRPPRGADRIVED